MSVKKNAAGWPNGWLQKCLKGAKCTKRAGHDATVDADEVDYTVEREVSYGGLTKKVTFPLKLKPNFRGAGYVLFKSCAKLGACDGAGKQAEFVLPNDTNLTTMSKNGLGDDKWDAMFGFLGVDSQCLDGVKCVDADGVTPEGAVTLTLKENPKFNVSISLLAVKKPENTVVSAACDGAGVCSAAGKVISLTGLLADGVSIMTGGTVAAAYSVVSTPADASTDCIDGSTVACSASATAAIGPFTYTITKSGVSYNASFYAGARKGFCSAASGHGACYSNGRLNACGASGQCSRAYCTAAASCNTDDQPFCGGYKAFSIGQWSQTCSRDTSKVDCTPSGQKGNPGCWAKGCIAESRSPCPSGDAKCAKLNSLHVFGEAQLNGLGSCGPFRISNPSGSAFIQLNSMTCISEMLPMSPLDGPVEALGSSTSITCGHPTDMTGSWANANSVPPKNRLLSELVVSLMNVHCIGTVVSNKNLQSVELSSTTIDGYVNQCTPYAGLTVSQVHDTAGECLFDKVCTDSIGGAVTPTELANCLNQLNRWSERYSD